MGVSVSLLSTGTTAIVGAVCFAAGYLLAAHPIRALKPVDHEDENKRSFKGAKQLLSWIQASIGGRAVGKRKSVAEVADNRKGKQKKAALLEIESLAEILEDFKMVLVVRNDLKMGKGKIAAQCSHATLGLYRKLHNRAPKTLGRWEMCGQVKVVLRTESEEDMLVLQERAKSLKLPTHITVDAGRTQIAPNSRTVMAIIGPLGSGEEAASDHMQAGQGLMGHRVPMRMVGGGSTYTNPHASWSQLDGTIGIHVIDHAGHGLICVGL